MTAGTTADRWYSGPAQDRRAYVVDDVTGFDGGQGRVVRAERRTFAGDPVGYQGAASLKLTTEQRPERVDQLRARWAQLAAIDHPHVARALEVFEGPGLFRTSCPPDTDDVLYVAAAWVEGQPLRERAPLDPPAAFALAGDLAAGLHALHDRDLVHRDIHPGNVVLEAETDRAVLIDLGSARPDDGGTTTTVAGSLGFIPPEALHAAGDKASDRWALGMVTVFALLGHPQGTATRSALAAELGSALAGVGDRRRAVNLLCAMVDPDPARRPTHARRWAHDLTACLHRRRGRKRVRALALVTAAAAAGLAATASVSATADRGRIGEPMPTRESAHAEPSCPPRPPGDPTMSDRLAVAVETVAPDACVAGPPGRFADAEVQPLVESGAEPGGAPDGYVILAPTGEAVRLTPAMWTSYREIAGKSPHENAAHLGGYPVTVERTGDPDAVVMTLTNGGVVVGRRDDTQLFWIPQQVRDEWEAHGGIDGVLGFPTTNPYFVEDQMLLDFERGYMKTGVENLTALLLGIADIETALLLDDPKEPLRGVTVTGRIVRQASGSAWWVDAGGDRHWIPDGATWDCLGGAAAVAIDQLPGWAVAALPLGDPATCP